MNSNILFQKFFRDRNIKSSTQKGYDSALRLYENFNNESIENLFIEARTEENERIPLKDRKIKKRLLNFEVICLTVIYRLIPQRHIFQKLRHFTCTLSLNYLIYHKLNIIKFMRLIIWTYLQNNIDEALQISSIDLKAVILYMSSSGTAMAETLSLSVEQFINGTKEYHQGGSL